MVTADIDHVRVCDCSICRKRGALNFRIEEADFALETPLENLTLYQWGSRTAKDYFCPSCGILPFRRPSLPTATEMIDGTQPYTGWAINVRCLDHLDLSDLPQKLISGSKL
ncbi:GFA family protein [Acidocella sp.]|uniref:GFA family protein n=1 Tax=Acidocella sp. TaxID=50710 RepID=UPI0026050245|nr:GFA family protein [Acidocella sp.]